MVKLNQREMKRARKDIFFGTPKEEQWGNANDVQRVVLHHIELLANSFEEMDIEELQRLLIKTIKWKEAKQSEQYLQK